MKWTIICGFALWIMACGSETKPPVEEVAAQAASQGDMAAETFDINVDESGVALRGYDAIAYYDEGASIAGKSEHDFSWRGVQWKFASAQNRDKFANDPERYAPSNGGYCTFGIVLRKKFDGDPEVWAIENERLYIFLNEEVKGKFFQDKEGNFNKVSSNWPYVQGKDAAEL